MKAPTFGLMLLWACSTNSDEKVCDLDGVYRVVSTPTDPSCGARGVIEATYHHVPSVDCSGALDGFSFSCEPGEERTYRCDGIATVDACSYIIEIHHLCGTGEPPSICQ